MFTVPSRDQAGADRTRSFRIFLRSVCCVLSAAEEITESALTTTGERYFDGREMLMVHDMFRREFGLVAGVVRAVAPGDQGRTQLVAGHLGAVATALHHHHCAEDEYVWPTLVARGPADMAPLVGEMLVQHQGITVALTRVDEALAAWRGSATAECRDALADALDRLLPLVKEHMRAEERNVVPLMEKYITAAEWNRTIQAVVADVDPQILALSLGMSMYEGDPEIVAITISNMPADVQPVIREVATQAFAAHSELIHGTATPPRSTEL
jgi:iron-sulfur cluster repair protein YtfE (RIC family)